MSKRNSNSNKIMENINLKISPGIAYEVTSKIARLLLLEASHEIKSLISLWQTVKDKEN